jgi:hypothetical protein
MKRATCIGAAILALVIFQAMATVHAASVSRIVFLEARPGYKAKLEKAIKKQMDWRREQQDDWRWLTWEYVSGTEGCYAVATFGHAWSDFDQRQVSPWVERAKQGALSTLSSKPPVVQYFDHVNDISAFGTNREPPTLAEIALFQLEFGKTAPFYEAVKEFHNALDKAEFPERYEWFELLSGGEAPQFMLMAPRLNWAAFDTQQGLLLDALEKSSGKDRAKEMLAQFNASIKSYRRYAVKLRPDLSKLGSSEAELQP